MKVTFCKTYISDENIFEPSWCAIPNIETSLLEMKDNIHFVKNMMVNISPINRDRFFYSAFRLHTINISFIEANGWYDTYIARKIENDIDKEDSEDYVVRTIDIDKAMLDKIEDLSTNIDTITMRIFNDLEFCFHGFYNTVSVDSNLLALTYNKDKPSLCRI